MPAEFQTEFDAADRQKRLALLMLERSRQKRPAGSMVGRFYVPDVWNSLADVVGTRRAKSDLAGAEDKRAGATRKYQEAETKGLTDLLAGANAAPRYSATDVGPDMQIPDTGAALQQGAASPFARVQGLAKILADQRKSAFDAAAKGATPDSVQKAATSGMDPRHLIPQPPETFTSPELMPGAPRPDGSPGSFMGQRSTTSNKINVLDRTPAPAATLSVDARDPLDASKQQREINARQVENFSQEANKRALRDVPGRTQMAMKALEILNDGNLNTGTLAGFKTAIQKAGGIAGFNVPESASDTEVYESFVKNYLPQLLAGFAPISEGEVKMAIEQLPTASKSPVAAKQILSQLIQTAISNMGDYNSRVEGFGPVLEASKMNPASLMPNLIPFGPYRKNPNAEPELLMDALKRLQSTPQNLPPEYRPAPPAAVPQRPPRNW